MTTKKTASELAAERLGYSEPDPHADVIGDVEDLLSRGEWNDDDRAAARDALSRARTLPPREATEPEPPKTKSASELAAERLGHGADAARRDSRGWV